MLSTYPLTDIVANRLHSVTIIIILGENQVGLLKQTQNNSSI